MKETEWKVYFRSSTRWSSVWANIDSSFQTYNCCSTQLILYLVKLGWSNICIRSETFKIFTWSSSYSCTCPVQFQAHWGETPLASFSSDQKSPLHWTPEKYKCHNQIGGQNEQLPCFWCSDTARMRVGVSTSAGRRRWRWRRGCRWIGRGPSR